MIATSLLDDLRGIAGEAHVITDPGMRASYETDWTRRFSGSALCVVRPGSTAEVAGVVAACAAHRTAVVTQGGNTGLVGGGVPSDGEVVLSTQRLTMLGDVDTAAAQVSVGAGVTVHALQTHARAAGLDFGIDLAARESATVGGLASTNAGGIRVLRHGSMRQQVVGFEAVLADGAVVSRMSGLTKDSTGYDLMSLLVGSEGTLAVLTALRVRLVPQLHDRVVALVAVDDIAAGIALLARVRPLGTLAAAEFFLQRGLDVVRAHTGLQSPFAAPHPAYVLLETAGSPEDALMSILADSPEVRDATIASDVSGRRGLWRYREAHTESISASGIPVKLDVSVPIGRLADLAGTLPQAVAAVRADADVVLFGHINEGNVHVNVLGAERAAHEVTDAVLTLVASLQGSISAEHGIGRSKVDWLSLTRSAAEIEAMRAIKTALDPFGILNPGVLFGDAVRPHN